MSAPKLEAPFKQLPTRSWTSWKRWKLQVQHEKNTKPQRSSGRNSCVCDLGKLPPNDLNEKKLDANSCGNITNRIVRILFLNFWSALAPEWNLSWWNFQMILFLKVFFHPSLDFTLNRCILPENYPGWQVYKWLWPIIKLHLKPVRAPR